MCVSMCVRAIMYVRICASAYMYDLSRRVFACAFMCVCVCVSLCAFEQVSLPLFTCHFSACIGSELSSVAMRLHRLTDHFSEKRKCYLH